MKKNIPFSIIYSLIIVLLYLGNTTLFGQKFSKVMGMPEACSAPRDGATLIIYQPEKKSKEPWVVISDRPDNKLYDNPDGNPNGKSMKFRDYAYVVEQSEGQGDWLRLVKTQVLGREFTDANTVVELGWIKKEKVLIWRNGLRMSTSNVHLKAFTLNKLKDIKNILKEGKRDILPLYDSPDGDKKLGEKTIYQFYFVYKKENDRYLLGTESTLALGNLNQEIIGWVQQNRIADWSTRLALEPNFEESAFNERLANPNFRLAAYDNPANAESHARNARMGNPFWKADPVTLRSTDLIGRRYPGGVVRFPMLQAFPTTCRTGIIGDIKIRSVGQALDSMKEVLYSKIIDEKDRRIRAKQNFDVIFVVEGSPTMENYRIKLSNMLQNISFGLPSDVHLRTAVSIYRDDPVGAANLFQYSELAETITNATNMLEKARFEKMGDYDEWTAMYNGLQQSLLKCGVKKEHTTIVFLIGNFGDYSTFTPRQMQAKKEGSRTLLDDAKVVDLIASLNVNLFAIQPTNNGGLEAKAFTRQTRKLIYESAVAQHSIYKRVDKIADNLNLARPAMPSSDEGLNKLNLTGGSVSGQVTRASEGSTLTITDMERIIKENINMVSDQHEKTESLLNKILDDGAPIKDISAGVIEGTVADELVKMQGTYNLTEKELINLVREKYKLYAEADIPLRITGANFLTVSFVLFMPEDDLREYMQQLREITLADGASIVDQRKALYYWMVSLAEKYGSLKGTSKSKIEDIKYEDLMNDYIQGIGTTSGFNIIKELNLPTGFRIGDLKTSKKFSDDNVIDLVKRIVSNTKSLNGILQQGASYEYAYNSNGITYYWIPVQYTF
jgi:hypothetical protein